MRAGVLLLPGGGLPSQLAYEDLLPYFGDGVEPVRKDFEAFRGAGLPRGYGVETEVAAIRREVDELGWPSFHLLGYSGGGAFALAFTAAHPDRVLSLALLEPAWTGNSGLTPLEEAAWQEYERMTALTNAELQRAFVWIQLGVGVEPPAEADVPPPGAESRPDWLRAVIHAFRRSRLDLDVLRAFDRPVYYALGARSSPILYARPAERLAGMFRDFTLEIFSERHHFDPPHRAEPERLASSLRTLWSRTGCR